MHPSYLREGLTKQWRAYLEDPQSQPAPPWVYVDTNRDPDDRTVLGHVEALVAVAPNRSAGTQPWYVRGVLRETRSGSLGLCSVCIEHLTDPVAEVTSVVTHGIQLARIRDTAAARLAITAEAFAIAASPSEEKKRQYDFVPYSSTAAEKRRARRIMRAAGRQPQRPGRKGRGAEHYRAVALAALELYENGRRDVLKRLTEQYGVPYQTVRDWTRKARELGFLAPTEQGRSQWLPGPALNRKEKDDDG